LDLIFSDIFWDNYGFWDLFWDYVSLGYTEFDEQYLPLVLDKLGTDFYPLYFLLL
jgi:hypothetical protein